MSEQPISMCSKFAAVLDLYSNRSQQLIYFYLNLTKRHQHKKYERKFVCTIWASLCFATHFGFWVSAIWLKGCRWHLRNATSTECVIWSAPNVYKNGLTRKRRSLGQAQNVCLKDKQKAHYFWFTVFFLNDLWRRWQLTGLELWQSGHNVRR